MARAKPFFYLVDGLNDENAQIIRKGLSVVGDVKDVNVNVARSMVEVTAYRDVEDQVKVACKVAHVHYRARAKRTDF